MPKQEEPLSTQTGYLSFHQAQAVLMMGVEVKALEY